ncbi:MAG: 3-phosphoshikimate 1-carboxyvinyltransferase [Syntrophaceae bacterium]
MHIRGEITPPGDKSISHRAFMFGALAHGTTTIRSALESLDVKSTREAMQALGADIHRDGDLWLVKGGNLTEPQHVIDAGNSGTTARLICGILAGINGVSCITGDASLVGRPMARVIKPLNSMGACFLARQDRYLPMAVKGGNLNGITYAMDIASAQVKSALLLAGLNAEGTTEVIEPLKSRDHTERMLRFFGVNLSEGGNRIRIQGGQHLEARPIEVPGDPSSAAFPAVLAAVTPGSELLIKGICLNPTRIAFLDVLKRMGAGIGFENCHETAGETVGDIRVQGTHLTGTTIQGAEIPSLIDELPILAIAAACAEGRTIIRDARELRVKEADRIKAMINGFAALGASVEELDDGMIINGPLALSGGRIQTASDHRIAMSFAVLSRALDIEIRLDETACVDISYPGFFKDMAGLV